MSKNAKVLLLLLCAGAASSAVRAGARVWIERTDSIALLATISAVGLMVTFNWIHPSVSRRDAPVHVGTFRKALVAILAIAPIGLLAYERPGMTGFLPVAVLLLSAPVAVAAPKYLKANSWLVLYGLLGFVAYSVSSIPLAGGTAPVRLVAAIAHAALVGIGARGIYERTRRREAG